MIPPLEKFRKAVDKCGGNMTLVAKAFGVTRATVYQWIDKDPAFKQARDDARGEFLDEVVYTARVLARGIPDVRDGKRVGWIEPPDPSIIRYLLSTLGRSEGFGEALEVKADVNSVQHVVTPTEAKAFLARLEKDY